MTFPPAKQRPALLAFAKAIDSRSSALRKDECGDWAIFGNNRHIYAVPEGFQLMIDAIAATAGGLRRKARRAPRSGWVLAKSDCEGSIILDRLPAKAEAVAIRDILEIPKARHLSEEQRANLIEAGAANLQPFRARGR
jgi:hypothetical protein